MESGSTSPFFLGTWTGTGTVLDNGMTYTETTTFEEVKSKPCSIIRVN